MAEIRVLDKHTAELIAAGEVVERPASVAKELLENAIDAGATQITLSAARGGIAQLQIADNGTGIEAEYIDKAFIRHATSKIATADDLGHIHTLGFRGEALASIASVAKVEVLTRTETDEYACCYRIEGGEPQGMEPGARPVGTTITVNDLFYNTPARMKFLKKDASEGTFVSETVLHAALSHPEISFRFLRDGKQQFLTPGDGDLRSTVYAVLGREFARDLLPVDGGSELYKVTGLVTPPRACRASRGAQHFFVNGRYVKNRTMMAALENAYKGTMMQGKFPGAVLMLEMPADLVDVNVHPAKTEIRFAKESDVFDAVYRAVRTALATPGSGECRFEMGHTASEAEQTTMQPTAPAAPAAQPAAQHRPAPDKNRFTTLSAAEYRALAGLAAGIPAKEVPGLTAVDRGAQLRELQDGVQVHTSGDRTHEGEHGDCLGDAQGHQDGQDDNADGDNGAGAHHGGEDEGSHNVQQNDGDDGTVAAQLNSLTDQGGGDAGLHQDAAKPGAPADVDQRGAPAFRGGLVDLVQDRNQRSAGVTTELQDGVLCNKCGRCDQSAQQRKGSPDDGDDQEADHQVVTFYAVVGQAEKGQDEDNANHKFHKKIPPSHGSRLQRCVSAM